jgi:hypothetical protein
VVSPRIGYVYGAGLADSGAGITVYAQQANGALTGIQDVLDGDAVHSTVLVHLKSGMALYDLTRHGIYAFRINPSTGKLTAITIPAPTSPVSAVNGLGAYDPLGHGLPGQPMLVTGACGTATADFACPFRFQTFMVNPVTGALAVSVVGPTGTVQVTNGITGDGLGHFAFGVRQSDGSAAIEFARATVAAGKTSLTSAGARAVADNATGQKPANQQMGNTMLITKSGLVEFPAYPLHIFPDNPSGWVAYGFGSLKGQPDEARVNAEVTASAEGLKAVFVGENGGDIPGGGCAIEAFGNVGLGIGGIRTPVSCTGANYNFINSMYEQGGYMYVARYQVRSLSFHDTGAAAMTPTAQGTVPKGAQIYSWAGFLITKPTVTVPVKLSLKTGIPITIQCPATCSGSSSASMKLASSKTPLKTSTLFIKAHAPGTFTVKLSMSAALRNSMATAIKKHQTVTVTTTTKVTTGAATVIVVKISKMGA